MSMFVRQFSEVLQVYASRTRTWLLGGLMAAAALLVTYVEAFHDAPGGSLDNAVICAYLRCIFLAALFTDQAAWQFTHSRAQLVPRFALPHLAFPILVAIVASVVLPASVAMAQHTSVLQLVALNSAVFGLSVAYMFTATTAFGTLGLVMLLPLLVPMMLRGDLDGVRLDWPVTTSIAVLAAGWMVTAYCFWRLAQLREEDRAYEWLQAVSCRGMRKRAGWRDRVWFPRSGKKSPPSWHFADLWNDRLGGYHQGDSFRVVRLLQHGFGPWAPGLITGWWFACLLFFFLLMFVESAEQAHDVIDPLITGRLIPALIVVFFPAAIALEPLTRRRPFLAAEFLLPLSRERLIDSLFRAAAWRMGILWVTGNAVAAFILWGTPGLAPSIWRMATYLFLSAVVTLSMFGYVLVTALWEEVASRIAAMAAFVIVGMALVLVWWLNRDSLGDIPFWIAGGAMLAFGWAMYNNGRRDWLNLELGAKTAD